jgi:hypothetical protein
VPSVCSKLTTQTVVSSMRPQLFIHSVPGVRHDVCVVLVFSMCECMFECVRGGGAERVSACVLD